MPIRKIRLRHHLRRHKKSGLILLFSLFAIFGAVEVIIFGYRYKHDLLYPQLARNQLSPKELLSEQRVQVDPNSLPAIIEHGSRYQYQIALTFDADMTPAMKKMLDLGIVKSYYDPEIKQTLDQEQVKATIFFSGLWVQAYPQITKELAMDPLIEIGNHSFSHPAYTDNCFKVPFFDNSSSHDEINQTQQLLIQATGVTPKYFRFPSGCIGAADLKSINQLGLQVIHWDVVSLDGFNTNLDSIVQTVESKAQNGSIIVFHLHGGDYAPRTNQALKLVIPYLKKRGYGLVSISQLLNQGN